MKYIRQEHIISTICNEEVSDVEAIVELLQKIRKENLDLSLSLRQGQSAYGESFLSSYQNVRVVSVGKDAASFCVYKQGGNVKLGNIDFDRIVELRVITKKSQLRQKKADPKRLDFMDV
jgi:hypothetical protein